MVNFIGTMPDRDRVLALPGAHHHDYGKAPRAGPQARALHDRRQRRPRSATGLLRATAAPACRAERDAGPPECDRSRNCHGVRSFIVGSGALDVSRPLPAQRTAVPAQPGPGVHVPEPDPLPRQGVHGVDDLVHGRLRRHHRRDRLGQDDADRDLPEGNRPGRGRRADQPDAGLADRVPADRCSRSSASARSRCARPSCSRRSTAS